MNGIHWIALVICILVPVITRMFWLSILINSSVLFITAAINDYLFFEWWNQLKETVQTEADHKWIADHDGGLIIVIIETMTKCLGTWVVSIILAFIMAKQKEKEEQKSEADLVNS